MRALVGAGFIVFTSCAAFGQSAATPAAFEVASVKVSQIGKAGGEGSRRENTNTSPGTLTMRNVSLSSCVRWAYDVRDYQVSGPDWLGSERYDIVAKAGHAAKDDQLRLMLQTLLADRFKLAFHRETKVLPAYALTVAKNGHKLRPSEGEGDSVWKPGKMNLVAQRTPMSQMAEFLSGPLRTPVLDMTGLTGRFDFTVDLAPYIAGLAGGEKKGENQDDIIAIIGQALQEQLGLKLEPKKSPIQMLVIDHAEKVPTEN